MAQQFQPQVKGFYKGQIIFEEGQESNVAYLVRSGRVRISKLVNKQNVVLATLGPGEVFGEMAVISGGKRNATAEAEEYSEVTVLTRALLGKLLGESPKTIRLLTQMLIKRLANVNREITERDAASPFMSFCRILHLTYENHMKGVLGGEDVWAKRGKAKMRDPRNLRPEDYLPLSILRDKVKAIMLITQGDIELYLDRLETSGMVQRHELGRKGSMNRAFPECSIELLEANEFLANADNLNKQMRYTGDGVTGDHMFMDMNEFAAIARVEPDVMYQKMRKLEIPEHLVFMHGGKIREWADTKGHEFFKKVKKIKKKIEDLEGVDDILFVDNGTLARAFDKLGYHKMSILMAGACDEARAKMERNMSAKLAGIVLQQADAMEHLDEAEVEDAEYELIDIIQELKGINR